MSVFLSRLLYAAAWSVLVQVVTSMPGNQPHRAEVAKLLIACYPNPKVAGEFKQDRLAEHVHCIGSLSVLLER